MRRLVHISDLHFGRTDPALVSRLVAHITELAPHLLVVSGDLTQRARPAEFMEARTFLDRVPAPRVVVPGNHDIALYDLVGRFVERLDRYKRYISNDVEPFFSDDEIAVACVNTARSLTFKGGRINHEQVERTRQRFGSAKRSAARILVAHHPLDLPAGFEQPLAGRSRMALRALADCGIHMILSGHLHIPRYPAPAEPMRIGGHTALLIQAGTAVSSRLRGGHPNSFNVIEVDDGRVTIEQRCWSEAASDFAPSVARAFELQHVHRVVPFSEPDDLAGVGRRP